MFKPAIRMNQQDFDTINTRLDQGTRLGEQGTRLGEQGTRLGDYMVRDVSLQEAEVNYVSVVERNENGGHQSTLILNGRLSQFDNFKFDWGTKYHGSYITPMFVCAFQMK